MPHRGEVSASWVVISPTPLVVARKRRRRRSSWKLSSARSRLKTRPHFAQTLSFFVATSGWPRLLTAKLKDFAFPFRTCSHRALFPWPPLRQAARCHIPQRAITAARSKSFRENLYVPEGIIAVTDPAYGSTLGDCACPSSPAQTPSLFFGM